MVKDRSYSGITGAAAAYKNGFNANFSSLTQQADYYEEITTSFWI
jgi:hypothetical protein